MADDFHVLKRIFNAFDPFKPLPTGDPVYVDCQAVRGGRQYFSGTGAGDLNG